MRVIRLGLYSADHDGDCLILVLPCLISSRSRRRIWPRLIILRVIPCSLVQHDHGIVSLSEFLLPVSHGMCQPGSVVLGYGVDIDY